MIPAVIGIGLVTFLIMRRWILAAFVLFVVAVESATYRATSLIVERQRPNVERLESLPVDASYPSGHTAAAVAMYGGLLLLLASKFDNAVVRVVAIVLGVAVPLFVGWSRAYRDASSLQRRRRRAAHGSRGARDRRLRRPGGTRLDRSARRRRTRRPGKERHDQGRRRRPRGQVDGWGARGAPTGARASRSHGCDLVEVPKSKYAPERVEKALEEGAETIFAWGGDGMVQRCVDVMAGSDARLAILPAGTANPVAANLDIPDDIAEAVHVGLNGRERKLDLGKMNGEHFAVMAGAGLDARMIRDADGGPKDRYGRLAYLWAASRTCGSSPSRRASR